MTYPTTTTSYPTPVNEKTNSTYENVKIEWNLPLHIIIIINNKNPSNILIRTHTPPQNCAISRAALIVINKSSSSESIRELRVRTYDDI